MDFRAKTQKIGAVAVFLSIISFMFVAGGVENLQPDPTLEQIVTLCGAAFVALIMGLFGISLINDE